MRPRWWGAFFPEVEVDFHRRDRGCGIFSLDVCIGFTGCTDICLDCKLLVDVHIIGGADAVEEIKAESAHGFFTGAFDLCRVGEYTCGFCKLFPGRGQKEDALVHEFLEREGGELGRRRRSAVWGLDVV